MSVHHQRCALINPNYYLETRTFVDLFKRPDIFLVPQLMSDEEEVLLLKEKGNAAYREKKYQDAICLWTDAEVMLKRRGDTTSNLAIAIRSNLIMAFMQSQLYERVVKESTLLLEDDPRHFKTLARRGTARERLANNRGSTASAQERKELHNLAVNGTYPLLLYCLIYYCFIV